MIQRIRKKYYKAGVNAAGIELDLITYKVTSVGQLSEWWLFWSVTKAFFLPLELKIKHEYFSAYSWREIESEKRCLNKKKTEVWEASIYGVSAKGFLVEISRLSWANDVHNKGAVLWLRNPPLFWLIASLRFMLIALLSHDFMRGIEIKEDYDKQTKRLLPE